MPFIVSSRPSYTWPVTYSMPVDGGKYEKHTFDIEFKRLPQSEVKKWLETEDKTDSDMARVIVMGWKGILDENKQEIPFSQSELDKLLELPRFAVCITTAYLKSIGDAPVKN